MSWRWDEACSFCGQAFFTAGGRRPRARKPFIKSHVLGQMFKKEDIKAHATCIWFAAGKNFVQHKDLPDEENFNEFRLTDVKDCLETHKKRKCYFCKRKSYQ